MQQDHYIAAGVDLTIAYVDADHVMALTPTQDITILIGRSHGILLDQKTPPRKEHQVYLHLRPPRTQNGFQHDKNDVTSVICAVDTIQRHAPIKLVHTRTHPFSITGDVQLNQ